MEKMLEEFEAECSKLGWDLTRQSSVNSEYYNNTVVSLCWTFWKESRAALCVDLPMVYADQFNEDAYFAPATRNALDDAGVSYK